MIPDEATIEVYPKLSQLGGIVRKKQNHKVLKQGARVAALPLGEF
jgi:hypothetical protein